MKKNLKGKEVYTALADIYQQLYLRPSEDGREEYADIVRCGEDAAERDLSHFIMNDSDRLEYLDTPAGEVCCVTLYERRDFETFLQIMGNKCRAVEIPATQGASILDGVINWTRIYDHRDEFIRSEKEKGNPDPDWDAEFTRFTADKRNYLDALIVLSVGPYSAIPAVKTGVSEDEWIRLSDTIRKYHECTHFICRRLYREKIDAVWDELVADAVGIYAAFGHFDRGMEELFLGISDRRYTGGRLGNYVKEDELSELSSRIPGILNAFNDIMEEMKGAEPYEIAVALEDKKEGLWRAG